MDVVHPVYLPFSESHLRSHFAPVATEGDPERHLRYYRQSAQRAADYESQVPTGSASAMAKAKAAARQMEKEERFWIAATLMKIFHAPDRKQRLVALLSLALGPVPPFAGYPSWAEALGGKPYLYFEANLPSPPSYKEWLKDHLSEHALAP